MFFKILCLIAVSSLVGCAAGLQEPGTKVTMDTPSKLSVIRPESKVRIVSLSKQDTRAIKKKVDDPCPPDMSAKLLKSLEAKINQATPRLFEASLNESPDASYLMNIENFCDYRKDDDADIKYNAVYTVKQQYRSDKKGLETGGEDRVVEERKRTATATFVSAVSIYDTKELTPLSYFKIITYDTDVEPEKGDVKSGKEFWTYLSEQVAAKIKDLTVRDKKKVGAFIPDRANEEIRKLIQSEDPSAALEKAAKLLPLPPGEMVELKRAFYSQPLPAGGKEKNDNEKKDEDKSDKEKKEGNPTAATRSMETDLANYYIYLTAKEATNPDEKNIKEVFDGDNKIMSLTEDEGLIKACAHSLGRIEVKAERLHVRLMAFNDTANKDITSGLRPEDVKELEEKKEQTEMKASDEKKGEGDEQGEVKIEQPSTGQKKQEVVKEADKEPSPEPVKASNKARKKKQSAKKKKQSPDAH